MKAAIRSFKSSIRLKPPWLPGTMATSACLMAMSAGLATSVLVGQSSIQQAQAISDYHLDRLFPASRPALRRVITNYASAQSDHQ